MALDQIDPLDDFDQREITFDNWTIVTHVAGAGPAVIVMTEIPGITPEVARFARWVRNAGFTVWMPSLFGRDGVPGSRDEAQRSFALPCVRREFEAFAAGEPSPMVSWLRQLAARAHAECDGPGVGAIGMCFTGDFALGMMLEPSMLAPVMSQPSMPLDDLDTTFLRGDEMDRVVERLARDDLTVRAYRFEGDKYATASRFAAFERCLGDRFVATVLPDSASGPGWTDFPHSVVTTNLVDEEGHPTVAARDDIIAFFRELLVDGVS
jgi:dienelactone hydrolase